MEQNGILIIGTEFDSGKETVALVPKGKDRTRLFCRSLPIDTLQANLSEFINEFGNSLNNIKSEIENYILDEIEISIEVSATGSIRLVGSIEAGATGGITLKFKRCINE